MTGPGESQSDWRLFALLTATLLAACWISLQAGAVPVRPASMFDPSGLSPSEAAVLRLRVARIALGLVAGAGLSVSGVVFQSLLRNPLAEPYVLGVSSGAGLGASLAIVLGLDALGVWTLPGMAFVGALGSVLLVCALARSENGAMPAQTLLLSGVVVGSVLSSLLMFLVHAAPSQELHNVVWWLLGNLQVFDVPLLEIVAGVVAAGVAVAMTLARDLNLMSLGDEPAAHLGMSVQRQRILLFILASLMTGATVAACGLIGFVGLIVPHSVRLLVGPEHRRLVPASALAGATFLVLADSFARTVLSPRDIPIGVVTAMLGGPFFLFLLRRRKAWTGD